MSRENILTKYKKMSVQAKAALWFVFCSLLQKGISFLTVPIFTRILTTEEYGKYSLFLSWLEILTIFTSLNLYYGVFNNGMSKFHKDRDRYIAAMQGLTITLCGIVFCVYSLFGDTWNSFLELSSGIMLLMFLEMLFMPALQFWAGRQRFEYKYKRLVIVTLLKSLANPILGIVMVLVCTGDKATARIISIVVIEVVFCGIILVKQFISGKCFFDKKYWKYALGLALPVLLHYLAGNLLSQGDRIMISKMVGNAAVAVYSVAYSIGMLVQIFTNAINNSLTPWLYEKIKQQDFKSMPNTVNIILLLVAGIMLCLMVLAPEAIMVFGSQEYRKAVYVIPPVTTSVFFIFLYNIFAIPEFYYEKTKFLMVSSVIAAAVNILLNYFFIRIFGYIAAGYTTLICYIIYSVGHYYISMKIIKDNFGDNQMFDTRFIIVLSIGIIVCGILIQFIYSYWFIRYPIIICAVAMVFVKRDLILRNIQIKKGEI